MKETALLLFCVLQNLCLLAQGTLQGVITSEDKEALVSAHIYILEISKGTIADRNGRFQFCQKFILPQGLQ